MFDDTQEAYRSLRAIVSERTRRLLVWCGAGLGMPAGLPDWSGLRRALSSALQNKVSTLTHKDRAAAEERSRTIALLDNPWIALLRLQTEVGRTTYQETVREALRPAASVTIPRSYSLLWRLRPAGILNLSLDRLATRAFHEVNGQKTLVEFNSLSVGSHTHVLRSPGPFVYNMHGVHEDASSWVLTHDEMSTLLQSEPYQNFVSAAVSTSTVLFVGLSADDVAVGGHLERLTKKGIEVGPHYWISSRSDADTDRWAEAAGIRMIRYPVVDKSHGALEAMLLDLLAFVPPEEPAAPPIAAKVRESGELLPPSALARQEAEVIRVALNSRASEILAEDSADRFDEFEKFAEEYEEAIHHAWFTSLKQGRNTLLGHTLIKEVAKGSFGRVFKAVAKDGAQVAIKLLHVEMRQQRPLLLAFRRGVRAMALLQANGVKGVATCRAASEIPALVVMDWVEGATLQEAVQSRRLNEWRDLLKAARELATVIEAAHAIPERVLHRDIRPANIMLEGFWSGDEWHVVVLDFDLSWHLEAYEQSVIHGSGTAGYLAPEQFTRVPGVSARHASVDSFGLGMTSYFMLSGADPVPSQHRHSDWSQKVRMAAGSHPCKEWRSIPARFARVIENATRDRQAERMDVTQVSSELHRLFEAAVDPAAVEAADLIAEEVAARAKSLAEYEWNEDNQSAGVRRPTGLSVEIIGLESEREIRVEIRWTQTGAEDWKRLSRKVTEALRAATAALTGSGWSHTTSEATPTSLRLCARCDLEVQPVRVTQLSTGVDRALSYIHFE